MITIYKMKLYDKIMTTYSSNIDWSMACYVK